MGPDYTIKGSVFNEYDYVYTQTDIINASTESSSLDF